MWQAAHFLAAAAPFSTEAVCSSFSIGSEGAAAAAVPAPAFAGDGDAPATVDELERYFRHLHDTLDAIDFHKGKPPARVMARLRRLYLRAAPDHRELKILHGILAEAQRMARLAGQGGD